MTNVEALKYLYGELGGDSANVANCGTIVEVLNAISAYMDGEADAELNADAIVNIADVASGGGGVNIDHVTFSCPNTSSKQCRVQSYAYSPEQGLYFENKTVPVGGSVEIGIPTAIGTWISVELANAGSETITVTQSGSAMAWRIVQASASRVLVYADYQRSYTVNAE